MYFLMFPFTANLPQLFKSTFILIYVILITLNIQLKTVPGLNYHGRKIATKHDIQTTHYEIVTSSHI